MMRGVSNITMSVCLMLLSLFENSCLTIGSRITPGNPVSDRRSSSRSSPASRFDSPSRSRSFVCTLREKNDGRFCPAMLVSCPRALFSIVMSRMMSPS